MKIAYILDSAPAYSETFFNNTIKGLLESGLVVHLYANGKSAANTVRASIGFHKSGNIFKTAFYAFKAFLYLMASPVRSIQFFTFNKNDGYKIQNNLRSLMLSAHIIGGRYDWLHFGFASTAVGRENLAKVMGAKMACSVRGFDLALYPLERPHCYKLLWKRLDKLHVLSLHLLNKAVLQGFDADITPWMKITPAIEINNFKTTKENRAQNKPLVFLTIARIHWIKGLDDTLLALSELSDINFIYHIIGDGPERQRLIFLAQELGISNKVHFHGRKSHDSIIQLLHKTDIYIQYSEHEGFCNALIEAQASGAICIAGEGSGMEENIQDDITGFLVKVRRPYALAQKIREIVSLEDQTRFRISKNARLHAVENYSLKQQAALFMKFYSTY